MKYFANFDEATPNQGAGHVGYPMLSAKNGCVKGCCTGISVYTTTEFMKPGIHDDQEGFVVLSGSGVARLGDQEFPLRPETSFIVPAGVPHSIKSDSASVPVRVFWFHAAV